MGSRNWERRTPVLAKPFLWCLAEALRGQEAAASGGHSSLLWAQALRILLAEVSTL